jgi:uncharacterized protein (DUF4415 family)
MEKKPNPYLIDDENPEWTEQDFALAKKGKDILSPEFYEAFMKRKYGKQEMQKTPLKKQVTLSLDAVVVEKFKATGAGWQSRINAVLNEYKVAS